MALIKHQIAVERKILTSAWFAGSSLSRAVSFLLRTADATAINALEVGTICKVLNRRELRWQIRRAKLGSSNAQSACAGPIGDEIPEQASKRPKATSRRPVERAKPGSESRPLRASRCIRKTFRQSAHDMWRSQSENRQTMWAQWSCTPCDDARPRAGWSTNRWIWKWCLPD